MVPDVGSSRPIPRGMGAAGSETAVSQLRRKIASPKARLSEAYIALLLFMVVYCARPEDWIPGLGIVPLAKIAGLLALVGFLISLDQIRQRLPKEVIFVILLTAQLFLTVPMSTVYRAGALNTTLDFAKLMIIVPVMVMAVNTATRLRWLLVVQAASVAAIGAVAIRKGHTLEGRLAGVLNGNYSNPNDLALAIVISLPLCLALMLRSRNALAKVAWGGAAVVMVYAIFLTGSRGGFLALAVTTSVCLWEFAIRGRRSYLLLIVALVGIVLCISSGTMLRDRLKGTFNSEDDTASAYGSAEQRQELFWRSLEVTIEHPLFGIGPGNFPIISGSWHETHNSYTQMSAEGGVLALVLYSMILWAGFKNLRRTRKLSGNSKEVKLLSGALRASLAGFVVGSLFASCAFQFFPYFLVVYTTVLLRIAKEQHARAAKDEFAGQTDRRNLNTALTESKYPGFSAEIRNRWVSANGNAV
jgi:putative inorganic carbon (hco3(-)) transporter